MKTLRVRILATAMVFLLPVVAAATDTPANSAAGLHPLCLANSQLTNSLSPVEIWASIRQCIADDRYEEAIFQYAMAGSFARFDALRVADESAREAARVLPMVALDSVPEAQRANFRRSVQTTLGDNGRRKQVCADVLRLGPPRYVPVYMVQHGLAAMSAEPARREYVDGFDATRAWPEAVKGYLQCP